MGAHVAWRMSGEMRVVCHVYPGAAPILNVWDGDGVALSITSDDRKRVSARHVESARVLAEEIRRYAEECARWVPPRPPDRVIRAVVCGACGSDRLDDGPGGGLCCMECGEASKFTEVHADTESSGEGATGTAE